MQKLFGYTVVLFLVLAIVSCENENPEKSKDTEPKTELVIDKKEPVFPKSDSQKDLADFVQQDLKDSTIKYFKYYEENIWKDSLPEKILYARLDFNMNDKVGAFHYVYVFNFQLKEYRKIKLTASPQYPVKIRFNKLTKNLKSIALNYRIDHAGFMMLYGQTTNKFDRIFSWQTFNLKNYQNDGISANYFDYSGEKNGFTTIDIYQGRIDNMSTFTNNLNADIQPEISSTGKKIVNFFMDLKSMKYATLPPKNVAASTSPK